MEDLMREIFQIRIIWPTGEIIPLIIRKDSTVTDLIFILKYNRKQQQDILLFYRGVLMNPSKTVSSQVPQQNELINAGFVKFQGINDIDFTQWLRTQTKVEEIYKEALRVNDFKLDLLENNPSVSIYYKEYLDTTENYDLFEDGSDASKSLREKTVVPKTQKISEEPLPVFWGDKKDSSQEDENNNAIVVPYFSSIEEAGDYFSKNRWGDWNW